MCAAVVGARKVGYISGFRDDAETCTSRWREEHDMPRRLVCLPLLFGLVAGGAHATCSKENVPSIPDGKLASEADLRAAQGVVKAYIASADGYLACVQAELDSPSTEASDKAALSEQYNAAVDEMQGVAGKWKKSITDFKSK